MGETRVVLAAEGRGIMAAYERFAAAQTSDPVARLAHVERVGATIADSVVGAVPLYGSPVMIGWQIVIWGIEGISGLLGVVPNALALRIAGSTGTTIVFLVEYYSTSEIPSDILNDALYQELSTFAGLCEQQNRLEPPIPSTLLVPP